MQTFFVNRKVKIGIFLFLNSCLPEFSYPRNPENERPHSSNSTKNVGGGGYSLIWVIRVHAAGQGMVFWPCCPKQGIQFDLPLS